MKHPVFRVDVQAMRPALIRVVLPRLHQLVFYLKVGSTVPNSVVSSHTVMCFTSASDENLAHQARFLGVRLFWQELLVNYFVANDLPYSHVWIEDFAEAIMNDYEGFLPQSLYVTVTPLDPETTKQCWRDVVRSATLPLALAHG